MFGRFSETLGQYLRRERESRTMSLEELSRATRIGLPFLEALERDDFNFFSQREFIQGFLQGYARHLGLNLQEVLGRYRLQAELMSRKETFQQMPLFPGTVEPEVEEKDRRPELLEKPRRGGTNRRWRMILQIVIVSVALGLSWYIHHLVKDSQQGEKSAPVQPARSSRATPESPVPPHPTRPGLEAMVKAPLQENGKITGDRTKKVYHLPGMQGYGKIRPEDRVDFASEGEASRAGYRRGAP